MPAACLALLTCCAVMSFKSIILQGGKEVAERMVYIITPTYRRPTQAPDLTRLMQTLRLATNLFWIVVEDSRNYTKLVDNILRRSGIPGAHLLGPTPANKKNKTSGRGAACRNRALEWIRENATSPGVVYFADDDNTYDVRLFDEIRKTRGISVFPVGVVGLYGVSSPVVRNGKVIGFHDSYKGGRRYLLDMAGFAVSLELLFANKDAAMAFKLGKQEDEFLRSFNVSIEQMEPLCSNCTQVYVWHTQTVRSVFPKWSAISKKGQYNDTNLQQLYRNIL